MNVERVACTTDIRRLYGNGLAHARPRLRRDGDRIARSSAMATASLAGVDILDDEPDTRLLFSDALEAAGACVRAVRSAADALREVDRRWPALLVTDLGLPGMDGYELLQAIRAKDGNRRLRAVAVSAYARLDDRTRTKSAGFHAHVAKPANPASLIRAIADAMALGNA